MRYLYLILFITVLFFSESIAQTNKMSWRKRAKMATDFLRNGDLYKAAIFYKSVYTERADKIEYSYKAGCCFLELRDYENAANSLEVVKDQNDKFDKPGYKYALALKQSGQPKKAKTAFDDFIKNYKGDDNEIYRLYIENEIKGCNYALKASENTDSTITIERLSSDVNSSKTEFAPVPIGSNVLYFSSTIDGVAKIYRTVKQREKWTMPQLPIVFLGRMEQPHYGNSFFTEDGKNIYFTQCDIIDGEIICAIYFMEALVNGEWSGPVKLPNYINVNGINTTHPFVVASNKNEILYFSSNRPGGVGGLDLWYTARPLGADINSFTLPRNLGRNINTIGDEVSPYYHRSTETLYFSTNGHISAGGLDIFKSKGGKLNWELAQNIGFPFNSSSDDLFYTISELHNGGYLVSNRLSYPERTTTTDDDLFCFNTPTTKIGVSGSITFAGRVGQELLRDVNIELYETSSIKEKVLIDQLFLLIGKYEFNQLTPLTSYFIIIRKEGFKDLNMQFTTGSKSINMVVNAELVPDKIVSLHEKTIDPQDIRHFIMASHYKSKDATYKLPNLPVDPNTGIEYTGDTLRMYYDLDAIASISDGRKLFYDEHGIPQPFHEPVIEKQRISYVEGPYEISQLTTPDVVYKIQVSAVHKFRAEKYIGLENIGRLSTENIPGGIKRVLVINKDKTSRELNGFNRKSDALNTLFYILKNTKFSNAFVAKYVRGERIGRGFRGWNETLGLDNDIKPDGSIPKDNIR
ncbi:outer membrane peptidoglycan-associated protein [Aureispira]|nr:outer membrane peptidoglycan-associated protein [Aureispira sp.]